MLYAVGSLLVALEDVVPAHALQQAGVLARSFSSGFCQAIWLLQRVRSVTFTFAALNPNHTCAKLTAHPR
jgi:hypothetical protein